MGCARTTWDGLWTASGSSGGHFLLGEALSGGWVLESESLVDLVHPHYHLGGEVDARRLVLVLLVPVASLGLVGDEAVADARGQVPVFLFPGEGV